MREQPADALALTLRKSWLWFGEAEERLVEPFFPVRINQARTLVFLPVEWQPLMAVALLGVLLVRGRSWETSSLLWLVYFVFSAASILFFIQLRFRLPLIPFVLLWAASLLAAAPYWRLRSPFRFWGTLAFLLLCAIILPGMIFLILVYIGLGWWGGGRRQRFGREGWVMAAVVLYLAAIGFWARAQAAATDISQKMDIYLGQPLAGNGVLGQTFKMDCDGLNSIEIVLGTFAGRHDQPVTFYLATDSSTQTILFSETFEGRLVEDYQQKRFYFEPIPDSAGRTFFFFLSSPTATPDNAITGRGYSDTPIDYYSNGLALAGQLGALQPLQADFAFEARCNLNGWQKVQEVLAELGLGVSSK
jgi:hypothetical protein